MSPLNKLFIFFASAYMSEAFPTDFDSKVTPFIGEAIGFECYNPIDLEFV